MPYQTEIEPSVWARYMFLGWRLEARWFALQQALQSVVYVGCMWMYVLGV